MRPLRLLLALLAGLALSTAAVACGGDDGDDNAATQEVTTADPNAQVVPTQTEEAAPADGKVSTDTSTKPAVPQPEGDPPTELVKRDIVKGKGRTARKGDNVTVQYVGVNHSNGAQFDASWDNGQPFTFTLGAGNVIPGWDQGVPGMKVGGRRELVIPPDLAYGPQGSPPAIGPNETLVFVIDLQKVESGQ